MFKKILIANQGEITSRIMRTAKKMGIATGSVYVDDQRLLRHECA
jgi:acetyl/propionyl-CoA carboxylase alpha subunit